LNFEKLGSDNNTLSFESIGAKIKTAAHILLRLLLWIPSPPSTTTAAERIALRVQTAAASYNRFIMNLQLCAIRIFTLAMLDVYILQDSLSHNS
jgi:hypothetical protein